MSKKKPPNPPTSPKPLEKIKSSVFSRGFSMARLGASAGAGLAGRGLASLWENKAVRDEKWKDFLLQQAQHFSSEVGELKGSLMKAGQMLSMYGEHFFPPEVNQFLKSLQHDSAPVKWDFIEKVLLNELGTEKMALLEIDKVSLASASLGQVHRAKIKSTGEALALKIQYPGVDKAIESDLRAIRGFLSVMNVLPRDLETGPVFDEIRRMLEQETDYIEEARWTRLYGERLDGDTRFAVPRVHADFSNRRVLATSFETGVRPDDPLVQALSPDRRNRLAANFLDLYFRELFDWHLVQTDPHAGNYRVRLKADGNDQWVLLDFGATRQYSAEFMAIYRRMIHASVLDDRAAFRWAASDLRLIRDGDDPKLVQLFEDFCFLIVEPFRAPYDWKNTDLPQRTTRKGLEILKSFPLRNPPEEILFLDRKTGGVFIMLNLLGAKLDAREILLRSLEASDKL